ncbi:MAG: ComEC family competence protein [Herpetosiphon sp.]|nr:ComEC family competence protein [Herpetosiphon sp.]
MILILLTIGWLVGIWVGDQFKLGIAVGLMVYVVGQIFVFILRRWNSIWLIPIVMIGFGFGIARMALVDPHLDQNHVRVLAGEEVQIEGIVVDEPRWTAEGQRMTIESQRLMLDNRLVTTHGLVLVELPPEPARMRGERMVIVGTLVLPESGRGFDYAQYLARRNVFVLMKSAHVRQAMSPEPSLRHSLLSFKQRTQRVILRLMPEPQASLLIGILLGIQSSVPESMWLDFNRTGTSHILVISGWNISIIVIALLAIAKQLGWSERVGIGVACLLIIVYVLLVGASASVVRAAIMGMIVAFAPLFSRRSDPWTALAAACLIMTIYNPQTLWDLGFQLSALATASLFAWSSWVEGGVRWLIRWRWLEWTVEPLTATLAAQIWALPIILYTFGNLSLIAPLANVLMVPVVPLAMAAGAALASLGLIARWVASLVLPLAWMCLTWLTWIAHRLAATPWAAVSLPPFAVQWILGFYLASLLVWRWISQRTTTLDVRGVDA